MPRKQKQLSPVERVKARHERRLKNLEKKKAATQRYWAEKIANIDTQLVETRAVLSQLSK